MRCAVDIDTSGCGAWEFYAGPFVSSSAAFECVRRLSDTARFRVRPLLDAESPHLLAPEGEAPWDAFDQDEVSW